NDQRLGPDDFTAVLVQARQALSGAREAAPQIRGAETPPHKQLAEAWIARAKDGGWFNRAGLAKDVVRFLLERMFYHVVEQPRLLWGPKPSVIDYRSTIDQSKKRTPPAEPPTHLAVVSANTPPVAPPTNLPQPAAVAEIQLRHRLPEGALRRFQAILARHPMS